MPTPAIRAQLAAFQGFMTDLFQKDFLLTWEHPTEEIKAIVTLAETLKQLHQAGYSYRAFDTGLAISIFRDNSTRTRFSFASAASALGFTLSDLDEQKSQVAHGETVRETANMISFLAEVIGIRDDMFLGEGNKYMREVGDALTDGAQQGVLHRRPSLINLQCDIDHPTQSLADLAWLKKHFGSLENLKGKKIAMTWAYSPSYGKPLSVPQGVIGLFTRFGMDVTLAHPKGYEVMDDVVEVAKRQSAESGGKFTVTNSMSDAFAGADIVYPKSWAPFKAMEERTELYGNGDFDGIKSLEKKLLKQNAEHKDWECTEELMAKTKNGKALYLHCLPADITGVSCEAGEVAATVFDRYRDPLYKQASFKPYVIAAMIFLAKTKDPAAMLKQLEKRGELRHLGI
ncbi:MAG: knotted carbamoyltransferase YgeW [Eubacteriales bacterium]|nr:knotted carbamoyltransferase YgeW [Eubacteriales bacterium]